MCVGEGGKDRGTGRGDGGTACALGVGIETLFRAGGVDVVELLLLLGLDVLVLLHPARVLHVGPVSGQYH